MTKRFLIPLALAAALSSCAIVPVGHVGLPRGPIAVGVSVAPLPLYVVPRHRWGHRGWRHGRRYRH